MELHLETGCGFVQGLGVAQTGVERGKNNH